MAALTDSDDRAAATVKRPATNARSSECKDSGSHWTRRFSPVSAYANLTKHVLEEQAKLPASSLDRGAHACDVGGHRSACKHSTLSTRAAVTCAQR